MLTAMGVLTLSLIRRTTGWPGFVGTLEFIVGLVVLVLCLVGWFYRDVSTEDTR